MFSTFLRARWPRLIVVMAIAAFDFAVSSLTRASFSRSLGVLTRLSLGVSTTGVPTGTPRFPASSSTSLTNTRSLASSGFDELQPMSAVLRCLTGTAREEPVRRPWRGGLNLPCESNAVADRYQVGKHMHQVLVRRMRINRNNYCRIIINLCVTI